MKHSVMIPVLLLTGICMITGCKSKDREKIDLSGIHTTAAPTAESVRETLASTPEPTSTVKETKPETTKPEPTKAEAAVNVSAKIETCTSEAGDKVTIQYPVVSNMDDASKQTQVNELLKANALAIQQQFTPLSTEVTLSVTCRVASIDRRRITAVYEGSFTTIGAAYPTNLLYSNTVDLSEVKSLGFNDYSDAYTMAGYVMSNDCEFYNVSDELKQALFDYRATQSLEIYTDLFNAADFPLKEENVFPPSFSYVDQSVLYFSIPVPHALGDYALVKFTLDGK